MKILLLIVAVTLAVAQAANDKKIVCYWGSWSVYRQGDGQYDLSYINPKLCTHMIYTFIGLWPNGKVRIMDAWADLPDGGGKDNFNRFNKLRQKNPALKTLIAIGGWNEASKNFTIVSANPKLRRKMVDSTVALIKKYKFDGFDVDWEYPAQREGSSPADKQNYILLLKELRKRFDKEGLILSAAVAAAESSASQSYNIPEMSKYLDFINIMAYDLHGSWEPKTGMNAAVYPASSESGGDAKLNVDAVIKYWLSQGAPAKKLILGVPFYGRSFTLSNPQKNGVGAPTSGAGRAGQYTGEGGLLGYNEICEKIKNDNWKVKFDKERKAVYAYKGDQWVGYDDERILKIKTDYIKKHNLGGAMVWSIETDDFRGKCGKKLPLLNTLYSQLRSGASAPQTRPNGNKNKKKPKSNNKKHSKLNNSKKNRPDSDKSKQNKSKQKPSERPTSNSKTCKT